MNRRGFIKSMLAAGAVPLMPGCFSAKSYSANGKVRLAAIGCGVRRQVPSDRLVGRIGDEA